LSGAALVLTGCSSADTTTPVTTGTAGSGATAAASPAATEVNAPGDIPDNQAFVPFTPTGAVFSVKVPEGWARADIGSTTTFTDKLNRIEVAWTPNAAHPTTDSVNQTDMPHLQAAVPLFSSKSLTTVTRPAGTAILVTYDGDSPANPVTGKVVREAFERYVFYHAGTRVDLTLSGPINADNVDPWRTVTDSLTWK
jgi:hypothetical protein